MGVVAGLYMYVVVVPVLFQLWFFSYSISYSYGASWSLCVKALLGQNSKVLQCSMT